MAKLQAGRIAHAAIPGFRPTQGQNDGLLDEGRRPSVITATDFQNRFSTRRKSRGWAPIRNEGPLPQWVRGPSKLSGAPVMATDLWERQHGADNRGPCRRNTTELSRV